jgi:hypothetical protein
VVAGGPTSATGGPAPGNGGLELASVPVPTQLGRGGAGASGGGAEPALQEQDDSTTGGSMGPAGGWWLTAGGSGAARGGGWQRRGGLRARWVRDSSPVQRCGRMGGEKGTAGIKFERSSGPRYIRRLTDEYTVTYIHRLTDECTRLSSSVQATFLGAGTEKYSLVIFLVTEKYKIIKEYTLFSYSGWRKRRHRKTGSWEVDGGVTVVTRSG